MKQIPQIALCVGMLAIIYLLARNVVAVEEMVGHMRDALD